MTAWTFGVDIGRVLVDEDESTGSKGLLNEEYLKAPPLSGAFEGVGELAHLADGRVYLVSRCGERVEQRTRRWLEHTGFWRKTGLDAAHLHFVRASHQKAPIAHKLGVNCFVDDSLRVLKCLDSVAELIYFRPDARGRAVVEDPSREDDTRFVEWRNRITMVDGWGEVLATVRGGQSAEDAPDPDCRILRPLRRENRIERSK